MELSKLDAVSTERRINANPVYAGILAGFVGLFASVPISIRQKDWRIWSLPFLAACCFMIIGVGKDDKLEQSAWKLMGWMAQGGLVGVFVNENKKQALAKR